jgi:hypothetical protein
VWAEMRSGVLSDQSRFGDGETKKAGVDAGRSGAAQVQDKACSGRFGYMAQLGAVGCWVLAAKNGSRDQRR